MPNVNNRVVVTNAAILQGSGKITFGGVDIGSYRDGVTVTVNVDYAYTRSDYGVGEIDSEATLTTCEINTIFEQATVTNLAVALGGNTSSSSSSSSSVVYDFGPELAQNPQILILEGMSAGAGTPSTAAKEHFRRYTFYKAQRFGSTAFNLRRGVETLLPITWKAFLNTDNKFFKVEECIDSDPA